MFIVSAYLTWVPAEFRDPYRCSKWVKAASRKEAEEIGTAMSNNYDLITITPIH